MPDPAFFLRLFAYDDWANDARAATLAAMPDPPARAVAAYAHLLAARKIWLGRISPDPAHATTLDFEPALDLEGCRRLRDEVVGLWGAYLEALTAERLEGVVSFRDSFGNPYAVRVEDALQHVLLHSAHHRGQIAMLIREAGREPGDADYYLSPMAAVGGG